jgi:hypothetical protein
VHGAQHVGQHVVGLDLEVVGLQLDGHVPVAQVVGGAQQVEGAAVLGAMRDDQHRLRRGEHAHHGAVLRHQHVAAAGDGAARQEHAQRAPLRVGVSKRLFCRTSQSSSIGGRALEQHGGEALPARQDLVDGQHVSASPACGPAR